MKILLFLILFVSVSVLAQKPDLKEVSNLEGGRRILEYFKAFNTGDDQKLKEFFLENLTADSLKQRPAEPRVEFHHQLRGDFQTLEIVEVESISIKEFVEVEILAKGKTGEFAKFHFRFEKESPQKIIGWQIERTDTPEPTEKSKYQSPKTKTELLSTVEQYLNDLVTDDKFSGVVLIAKNDKPIYSKAFGLADRENKTPNNTDTKFNLGSINKIFTRIAIGQLVSQGKISFDDKLSKFLPDYPNKEAREKVTIRHLVTMKSGIRDFFGYKFEQTPKNKFQKNSDFIPLFSDIPLAFEPGTKEQYSNGGYILLGAIIEKVTGKSYYDYVRENIFNIAGMTNTDSFLTDNIPLNTANGYSRRNPKGELENNVDTRPFRGSSAGGGYSNTEDLLKFSIALKEKKLTIPDDDGKPRLDEGLGIAGGSPGINSILLMNPITGYTIIVLANFDPPSAEKVGEQFRDWTKQVKD